MQTEAGHLDASDDEDKPHEACGVFGIWGHKEASKLTYLGLYALQHRGQESCGIAAANGETLACVRKMGLVADSFGEPEFNALKGHLAIGHVRYSTTGSSNIKNAQPIFVDYARGSLAIAHNGNLTNTQLVRSELEAYGSIFTSSVDSEVIVHLIARSPETRFIDTVVASLKQVQGAYSLMVMNERQLIGVRDPNGFRPLCLGRLGEAYILASETCAFDIIDAEYVRDVEPGEMVVIDKYGLQSFKPFPPARPSMCVFEFIYFARPDSSIYSTRCRRCAAPWAASWHASRRCRPTWWCRCPTRAWRPPSATARRAASPSKWGSSATTMWAAPSSSPASTSATLGSRSSSTRCATCWKART